MATSPSTTATANLRSRGAPVGGIASGNASSPESEAGNPSDDDAIFSKLEELKHLQMALATEHALAPSHADASSIPTYGVTDQSAMGQDDAQNSPPHGNSLPGSEAYKKNVDRFAAKREQVLMLKSKDALRLCRSELADITQKMHTSRLEDAPASEYNHPSQPSFRAPSTFKGSVVGGAGPLAPVSAVSSPRSANANMNPMVNTPFSGGAGTGSTLSGSNRQVSGSGQKG